MIRCDICGKEAIGGFGSSVLRAEYSYCSAAHEELIKQRNKECVSAPLDAVVSLAAEKYKKKIIQTREIIVEAFIAETGLKPSEIEQVEERTESGARWYLQKRKG